MLDQAGLGFSFEFYLDHSKLSVYLDSFPARMYTIKEAIDSANAIPNWVLLMLMVIMA